MQKIIIVGGGIAGITAAINAKNEKNEVIVLEKNKLCLKKALITGNGHCNYFNDNFNYDNYYSKDNNLVPHIINEQSKKILINFYNKIGLVPKIKHGYYYPHSNQAFSFFNALMKEARIKKIKIVNEIEVKNIILEEKFIVETNKEKYMADKLIIATGSYAYPKTGSTGDGYLFSKNLNHYVNEVYPALVQLNSDNKILKELDGIRCEAKVTLLKDNNIINSEIGEVQFTNYGLSGICIYNLSLYLENNFSNVEVAINPFYSLNISTKEEMLNYLKEKNSQLNERTVVEILEQIINYKLVNAIFKSLKLRNDLTLNDFNDKELDKLVDNLVNLKFKIMSTKGYENSQVCGGGVSLKEININDFSSKKMNNLYIVGEILDITGKCGGYNISLAVLSGIKAGISAGDNND